MKPVTEKVVAALIALAFVRLLVELYAISRLAAQVVAGVAILGLVVGIAARRAVEDDEE